MNKLIEPNSSETEVTKRLPLSAYPKVFKMIKNLLIYGLDTLDKVQMEVFASNTEVFTQLETHCLAYVANSAVVPLDVCCLIRDLIDKCTSKTR